MSSIENVMNTYEGSTDISLKRVGDRLYIKYTVEDGTVLVDKWYQNEGSWEVVATARKN